MSTTTRFAPTTHPILPMPTMEEMEAVLARPGGDEQLATLLDEREKIISRSKEDPYRFGFEFPQWHDADALVRDNRWVYVGGGKRASKSEWAAKRIVQSAMAYPGSKIWCFQDNETTSINTQQPMVWRYLPLHIKALNNKRHSVYKIKYAESRGFTEMFLVLPNKTSIHFLTYNQDPEDFQGWELGARVVEPVLDARGHEIPNLGAWADENLAMAWFQTLKLRLATRTAKLLWTFSPLRGITATIKHFRGTARTIISRPAELLAGKRNVEDCPVGHMPYIQQPTFPGGGIIYFYTEANPFGNYREVAALLEGRPTSDIKQDAYGYAEDSAARAFPLFGAHNIVKPEHLPAEGTNYKFTDPAGSRNWATLWVRVTADNPPLYYIYRDWPDMGRFGEWAQPSNNPRRFDGDPGPAQGTLGYGVLQYKRLFLEEERVTAGCTERDPHRQGILARLAPGQTEQESIFLRYIDPRAGRNQHIAERGGTCLVDEFAREHRDPVTGRVDGPQMIFDLASGVHIEEGKTAINTLLYWDRNKPLVAVTNAPRLYVAENCQQIIWALENWTGKDGETGACKDFVDLVRYMALQELQYLTHESLRPRGGGSY